MKGHFLLFFMKQTYEMISEGGGVIFRKSSNCFLWIKIRRNY